LVFVMHQITRTNDLPHLSMRLIMLHFLLEPLVLGKNGKTSRPMTFGICVLADNDASCVFS
jgi:hypothetical protein